MTVALLEHDAPAADFATALRREVARAPWFLFSLALHAVLAIVLHFFGMPAQRVPLEPVILRMADETLLEPPPVEVVETLQDEVEETDQTTFPEAEPMIESEAPPLEAPSFADAIAPESDPVSSHSEPMELASAPTGVGFGATGAFGGRRGGGGGRGRNEGRGQAAVTAGLEWLARHQSKDGSWDADQFMQQGDPKLGPLCDGKGRATNDVGLTGLALLAFLGAGHDHRTGPYREHVRNGLSWLKESLRADGSLLPMGDPSAIYNQAIGTLALVEGYAMTLSPLWKKPAQSAFSFCLAARNPYRAWRYGVRPGEDDVSVTGWMIMVLHAAKEARFEFDGSALRDAMAFIEEMTDPETGRTGYQRPGELPVRPPGLEERFPARESESLTAVAMLSRIFAGEAPARSRAIAQGQELLLRRLPVWEDKAGKVDQYYWYYGTLAMFQIGGPAFVSWNERLETVLLAAQRKDGNFAGSFDPVDAWGEEGGRIYSTALMTLCLQVHYRYGRVFGAR